MKIKTKGANDVFDYSGSSFDSFLQEEGIRDDV
jgi:antitoxin HicB